MTGLEVDDVIARARPRRERAIAMQNSNVVVQARLLEQSERPARLQVLGPRRAHCARIGKDGRP